MITNDTICPVCASATLFAGVYCMACKYDKDAESAMREECRNALEAWCVTSDVCGHGLTECVEEVGNGK